MPDESFSKADRIKSPREFERAFKQGIVVADGTLILHATLSTRDRPRLGVAISKRAGNAPYRNYWKRLVREAFRRHKHSLPNYDYIVRPKRGAAPNYAEIYQSIYRLVARVEKKLNKVHVDPKS